MKLFRVHFFLVLTFVFWTLLAVAVHAQKRGSLLRAELLSVADFRQSILPPTRPTFADFAYHPVFGESDQYTVATPADGGIREVVPAKLQVKYQSWKNELLSTEFGRRQWESYSNDKRFVLTITFGGSEGQGAGTGNYQWDESGALVGATITLGNKLDTGLPNAVYFPVMNSLSSDEPKYKINKNLLAAAKLAHEFGHVNQTARMNGELFRLQNELMPVYNEILLKNGYNTGDRNLIELTEKMGGTPVEIWENREYWGETNAMLYLFDRLDKESFYCPVFNKIKRNISLYAKDYEERFEQIEDGKKLVSVCH